MDTIRSNRRFRRSAAMTLALAALLGTTAEVGVNVATASHASAATIDSLTAGGTLAPGDILRSPSGQVYVTMQGDGNLVIYRTTGPGTRAAIWASGTTNQPGAYLTNQGDGNLVIYKPLTGGGRVAVWASGTGGREAARLIMQDDDNLVLYGQSTGQATWSWKTGVINAAPTGIAALRQQIVNTALAELGQPRSREGASNCNYYSSQVLSTAGTCTTPSGAPGKKEAWCAQFTRWVYKTAGAGNYDRMNAGAVSVKSYGTWRNNPTNNVTGIQPGDLIGFRLNSGGTGDDHVGIVVAVNGTSLTTVEGNTGDNAVARRYHKTTDADISGYATPVPR